MMFFSALLSFSAGYFLNEEKSLARLCKNLGYTHEGWFVLHDQRGFFIYFIFIFLSFFKGWFWSTVCQSSFNFWFLPVGMYLCGNFAAIDYQRRFHFTFWCTLAGTLLGLNKVLFQILLTAVVVFSLLSYIFQEIVTFGGGINKIRGKKERG